MTGAVSENVFVTNLWATPADWHRDLFYCAVRAGHLRAGKSHRIQRETYPGHEWILCLGGQGWVQVAGRRHAVRRGELVWVNCHHPHAYGAVAAEPWEVLWVRAEGRGLDQLGQLMMAASRPVLEIREIGRVMAAFERVLAHMGGSRPSDAAECHAAMAEVIALCFACRLNDPEGLQPDIPDGVRKAVLHMRTHFGQPLRLPHLSAVAGLSESTFGRQFRASMGTSPIDWLRHERINQAKRRLLESDDSIKEVARQVGYSDQFFFSKDFKRMTQVTPTEFRMDERK